MAPTRFTSGALITRNNFDALDGGFPGPRPRGRTSGRHTRAGFSFWRNDVPLGTPLGGPFPSPPIEEPHQADILIFVALNTPEARERAPKRARKVGRLRAPKRWTPRATKQ